jgi:two-component system NtrC family response regulator
VSVTADDLRAVSEDSDRLNVYARNAAVLVVDDEPGMRNFLSKALKPHCALVETADSAETAEALRRRYHFDLMILDIRLPGLSGVEWLNELRAQDVRSDVIVMTAYADLETAVQALRAGAADFLLKPFRLGQIIGAVNSCLERRRIARENFLLRRQVPQTALDGIVGGSHAIREVVDVIQRVAPTNATVLIEGETGTGKELVAQAIHHLSGRQGPFVPVNSREGLFSFAHGGTLFLDEISEMSLEMQAKLLRALETKSIRPLGADRELPINVRVIAATNRQLSVEMEAGHFREDLFFRLNVLAITVPPLRERIEDIAELARHFSQQLSNELGTPPVPLAHEDIMKLRDYDWPGNVRELRNVIERSLLLGKLPGDLFTAGGDTQESGVSSSGVTLPLDWSMAEVEKHHMLQVLEGVKGNKSKAAKSLGVSRKTLERKLKGWKQES